VTRSPSIVLLRGINLGARNRIAMPALRAALERAGHEHVRTYLQSGNVVLDGDTPPARLADDCARLIATEFGLEIGVVVRTRDELAAVVERNPLAHVVSDEKRYQVSFLAQALDPQAIAELAAVAVEGEQLVAAGRELYAWHPHGVARSRLSTRLASPRLGVLATARNWSTTTALLALADA
jgi:uncharacterized protein (DUF1697 family)